MQKNSGLIPLETDDTHIHTPLKKKQQDIEIFERRSKIDCTET